MISKHRNRGLIQIGCALALTALVFVAVPGKNLRAWTQDRMVLVFVVYIATVIMWMVASFSLAKAKGYSSDETGAIFLFLFIVAFCFPIAAFLLPGVVIFGLKDRARVRRRRSSISRPSGE